MSAIQANIYNNFKNTKLKILKTNAAIWFNKTCKTKQIKPNYINIKISGRTHQDRKTTNNAIRYRINQEIKFLYRKKQHLNQQLYHKHLECANLYQGMWQHIYEHIDQQLHIIMNTQYTKLNKKLDKLVYQKNNQHNRQEKPTQFTPRLINLTNVKLTKEQIHTLSYGPNFAIEQTPNKFINELIIDTENAIRQLEPKLQTTYRHLASKQIKHILNNHRSNTSHKRQQYIINEIRSILHKNNLTIVSADKSKAIIIINKDKLEGKIMKFIQENNITKLNKDPTDKYQKQIQQKVKSCNLLIDKHTQRFLIHIKPMAPTLNVRLKTHKENEPIRPVINNINAPAYNVAKYLNKRIQSLIHLPDTYNIKNSKEIAEELTHIHIDENSRLVTYDIKDLFVNLPIQGITNATNFWLRRNNTDNEIINQITQIIQTILYQNYFQYNNQYFQPSKGIAMGSPISSTVAEIYLQFIELQYIKHWLENKDIIY